MEGAFYKEAIDYGTLGVLGLMGFIALFFSIERWLYYRKVRIEGYDNKTQLEIDLTNNLSFVATIASNAPYVGLLGTVFGIMVTFYLIGQDGLTDTRSIMVGLALALKATAMGLAVAIPSMIAYNLLVRRTEVLLARWDIHTQKSDGETA